MEIQEKIKFEKGGLYVETSLDSSLDNIITH
jgi:hypothetical protein